MAPSPLISKSHFHARSISLPSRSHLLIPQFNDRLCRLRASESTSSSSLPSISNRLSGLEDFYDRIDNLLLLPHTQQNLARGCNVKWFHDALDGYLKVLDGCATAKDIFSQTKEDVTELLSSLRRKRDASNVGGYLASRKKMKKAIEKLMRDLKRNRKNNNMDKDDETVSSFSMLREVEAVTLAVLESLLSYVVVGTKLQPKRGNSGWSLVSKLMKQEIKSEAKEETVVNEFEEVDEAAHSLLSRKASKSCDDNYKNIETLQTHLVNLEFSVQGIEEVLEKLIRRLIKTRVSLLNILNH